MKKFAVYNSTVHARLARYNFYTSIVARKLKCQTEQERLAIEKEVKQHNECIGLERTLYHERTWSFSQNPDRLASIIIDSPEKITIPNIVPIPKKH